MKKSLILAVAMVAVLAFQGTGQAAHDDLSELLGAQAAERMDINTCVNDYLSGANSAISQLQTDLNRSPNIAVNNFISTINQLIQTLISCIFAALGNAQ